MSARRPIARALALVLAMLIATPVAAVVRAFDVACHACPPTCPMHRHATKPRCHEGNGHVESTARPAADCELAGPGCPGKGLDHALDQTPGTLMAVRRIHGLVPAEWIVATYRDAATRLADPPDPPPPDRVS